MLEFFDFSHPSFSTPPTLPDAPIAPEPGGLLQHPALEPRLVPAPNTRTQMNRLIWGYRQSQSLGVAVELALAEKLAGGARSAGELAKECGVHEPSLRRLLRLLAAMGVLFDDESGRFALTYLGEELRQDRLGPIARLFTREPHWMSWLHLNHSVKTGESAFAFVHGMRNWDYYAAHPEEGAIFDAAMSALTGPVSRAVAMAYDFSRFKVVADVGGGDGTLLAEILQRNPSVRGLIYDLPAVTERTKKRLAETGLADRFELIGGSFLDGVPPGADLYLMKSIIHDWSDEEAGTILKHCRAAAGETGAPLLLVERVLPAHVGPDDIDDLLSDLNMLVNLSGRERTEAEFGAVLQHADFKLDRVIPTGTAFHILESVPV